MGYLCNRNRKQRSRSEDSQEQPYTYVSDQEEPSRSLLQSDSALATRHQDGSSVYSMNTLANRSNSSFRSRVKSGSMRSRTAGSQITHSVVDDEGVWRSRSAESLTSVLDSYPPSAENKTLDQYMTEEGPQMVGSYPPTPLSERNMSRDPVPPESAISSSSEFVEPLSEYDRELSPEHTIDDYEEEIEPIPGPIMVSLRHP